MSDKQTTRWQYHYLPMSGEVDENIRWLNHYGSAGWEAFHVGRLGYWLKRPVGESE